ncbi:unconventional myosin-VI-like [Anabas testudineus]|uniref:unconventional myosin-VI-like n=1 Tax=Anabas testudineus TaxID=64144 RepID=UPI000E4609C5|nr:unconventional myosin-VI-like [Anabas testudineus]
MDCLALLVKKHTEVKTSEEHWEKRCEALKESLQQEMAHREEDWRRKVQEVENEKNLLCEEWHRKEEEWRKKESRSDEHINLLTPNNNLLLEVVKQTKAQVERKIEEARQLQEKLKENNDLIKINKIKIQACRKANRNRLALVAKNTQR